MWRSSLSGFLLRSLLARSFGPAGCRLSRRPLTLLCSPSASPASTSSRVLDDAGVVLLFRDKLYLLPVTEQSPLFRLLFSAGHCRRNYATSSSSYSTFDGTTDGQQDCKVLDCKYLNAEVPVENRVGKNISSADKRKFLINTLLDLKDSKEAVYGTLDAWVAWEHNFPLATLKRALIVLEKEEQWHRVIQVIKWMLSKGQGITMGTYEQLIRALERDNRAEEAHIVWRKKISHDLHSVPWRFCDLMLSIYYRNNMLERLVKLFQELEAFDRKPPSKSIVRKVGDAYEVLGLLEEKKKLLEKYDHLFSEKSDQTSWKFRKSKRVAGRNDKRTDRRTLTPAKASNSTKVDSGPSEAKIDSRV